MSIFHRAFRRSSVASRLVDAYEEGLLEKSDFEPRLRRSRDRLTKLEAEAKKQTENEA